jgi:hypothetical protein
MLAEKEKRLLKQQAEAYAFIYDVRRLAISRGDRAYILKTHGVEDTIEARRKEYPRIFQRYFQAALQRAEKHRDVKEKEEKAKGKEKEREGKKEDTQSERSGGAVIFTSRGKATLPKKEKEKKP